MLALSVGGPNGVATHGPEMVGRARDPLLPDLNVQREGGPGALDFEAATSQQRPGVAFLATSVANYAGAREIQSSVQLLELQNRLPLRNSMSGNAPQSREPLGQCARRTRSRPSAPFRSPRRRHSDLEVMGVENHYPHSYTLIFGSSPRKGGPQDVL